MSMNSLSQGKMVLSNKASKNRMHNSNMDSSVIPGVENHNNITAGNIEGFTGNMGETKANLANAEEAAFLARNQQALDKALSDYSRAREVLMRETVGFVNSERKAADGNESEQRLGGGAGVQHQLKAVKYADGKMAIITDKGIIKPMSNETWNTMKGKYGCPSNFEDSTESLGSVQEGDLFGENNQFVGSNFVDQGCHASTGINARVMSASDPRKASSSYQGSILMNQGNGSKFEYQNDLDQTWDQATANNDNKLDLCASRAVDLGRTGYGVYRDGYDGSVKCAIAPNGNWDGIWENTLSGITPKINTVIGTLDSNRWNSVSMMYDGRVTKSDIPAGQQINQQGVDFDNYVALTDETVNNETDPTVGSRIHLKNATYGQNCNGQENVPATNEAWRKYNEDTVQCSIM
uniref:Uncharacterized protein n=1 Tax=viral metagenome TaxID=1070528 RepID=A0A6C0CRL9_9ZZZZ